MAGSESATHGSALSPAALPRIAMRTPSVAGSRGTSPVHIMMNEKSGTVCKPMIASLMSRSVIPTDSPKLSVITTSSADGLKTQPLELKSGEKLLIIHLLKYNARTVKCI